ncbi:MAG: archaeosortase/exosortase family protein [Bacteroidetes bacterium]|nr:archaeosortase/exosortase family protein [Bacteroidota bacterium]
MREINSLKKTLHHKSNLFLLQMALVYLSWKLLYYGIEHAEGKWREGWLSLVHQLSLFYADVSVLVLRFMGEAVKREGIGIHFYELSRIVDVEEHCLAIPAMYIFIFSIALFSGSWKNKLWFIPLGLLGIAFINVMRLVPLAFVFAHLPDKYFIFHHSFLFVAITYGLILAMVRIWMKYFSNIEASQNI